MNKHSHKKRFSYIEGIYKTLLVPKWLAKKIIVTGTPLLINEGMWSAGMAAMLQGYSMRGLAAVAGMNIANTIINLFSVMFIALGNSVAIIIGKLLGAGKMEEAKDTDRKMIFFAVLVSISQKKSYGNAKRGLFRMKKMLYTKGQCEENYTFMER